MLNILLFKRSLPLVVLSTLAVFSTYFDRGLHPTFDIRVRMSK